MRASLMLGGASLAALVFCLPSAALAQDGAPGAPVGPAQVPAVPAPKGSADVDGALAVPQEVAAPEARGDAAAGAVSPGDVVVTGTRLTSGFTAPTPTTVVSVEQIQQTAQPNVYDALTQLPALQGSAGSANARQNGGTSVGNNGISSLNLRGLGSIRTLTLIDGQRVVPAFITGIADVSQFPQLLIKRVDVVTGGASASWGSDAVAGVVNFVTDTKYAGFKANAQYGLSTYGDDESVLVQAAGGISAMDDRLHAQLSGEYYDNKGVPGGEVGGAQRNGRPTAYRSATTSYALAATPAGAPQFYAIPYDAQNASLARYGLITAGTGLAGTAFNANGTPYAFQYGTNCVPSQTGTCVGGDQSGNPTTTTTIDNPVRRLVGYGRVGIDVAPGVEVFASLNVSDVRSSNTPIAYPRKQANLTIQCSNPYLPPSIATACTTNRIASFTLGTTNSTLPGREEIYSRRQQVRYVVGANGSFEVAGMPVQFDAYYQHGQNKTHVDLENITLNPRYNAAIAASVVNGQIVCSNAVARAGGCLPINIFGNFPVSAAQFAYIAPANGPFQYSTFKEDATSIAFNFKPFSTWAGEVSVAVGAEGRREYYRTTADPYGNGITATTAYDANYPADPLLSTAGNNWFAGNYKNGTGVFTVKEAFVEVGLPIADSESLGKFDVNLAGRVADYSTAGNATTWKVGATWETPLDGLRLRGVVSRDLRAPNLSELFAAPISQNNPVINRATGIATQVLNTTIGNANLKPEIAKTYQVGLVYRPAFLPGLNLSFDYFSIRIDQAIQALTAQQIVDLCFNGNTSYCPNVNFATAPLFVTIQPFNLASERIRGFDLEGSYTRDIGNYGRVTLRALTSRTISYERDTGISGQQIAQLAGNNSENGSGTPDWKFLFGQTWAYEKLTLNLIERVVTAGKIDPEGIECQAPTCPVSTVQHPTYSFNRIPGAFFLDAGMSYEVTRQVQGFAKVDNLFNHRAPPFGSSTLYDQIGRIFRIGARFKM